MPSQIDFIENQCLAEWKRLPYCWRRA